MENNVIALDSDLDLSCGIRAHSGMSFSPEKRAQSDIDDYVAAVSRRGHFLPVVAADVRVRDDVVGVLEVLFQQIESLADAEAAADTDEWLRYVQQARSQ